MRAERNKHGSFRALIVILVLLVAEIILAPSSGRKTPLGSVSVSDKPAATNWVELASDRKKPGK